MFRLCHFQSSRHILSAPVHLSLKRHFAILTMDITSGDVAFGRTCPGTLMQSLRREQPSSVAAIKKLQLSFASAEVTYQCPLPTKDLRIVHDFVAAIDSLEELSVLHYERDGSNLWPAVFHHAKSLRSLSIHTPPQDHSCVWTPETAARVTTGLTSLEHLEVDIPLEEAESLLSGNALASDQGSGSIMTETAKMARLESLLVNIPLSDAASPFAGKHTWNAMGSTSFPAPNKEACESLARALLGKFSTDAALKKLEVRFPRRCWDDRCQFWTLGYSVRVGRDNKGGVAVEHDRTWAEYLPEWPEYGEYLWNLMQERRL